MKFYYSPGACSLASHIALEEAGADFDAIKVDLSKHETEDGEEFFLEVGKEESVLSSDGEVVPG